MCGSTHLNFMKAYSKSILVILIICWSCSQNKSSNTLEKAYSNNVNGIQAKSKSSQDIQPHIFAVAEGFGYDILINGDTVIHQPFIPGLPGNRSFKTKEDASKIADLVIKKIKKNQMPPSVIKAELDSLGLL